MYGFGAIPTRGKFYKEGDHGDEGFQLGGIYDAYPLKMMVIGDKIVPAGAFEVRQADPRVKIVRGGTNFDEIFSVWEPFKEFTYGVKAQTAEAAPVRRPLVPPATSSLKACSAGPPTCKFPEVCCTIETLQGALPETIAAIGNKCLIRKQHGDECVARK
jgi:hypothetical protein